METFEDEFETALDVARNLIGSGGDAGELWEANMLVSRALTLRPDDADAWILKAQIMSFLDDDCSALAAIEMAARRRPRMCEAQYWRAAVLADLEQFHEALKAVERAFRYLSKDDEWLVEDLYCEKAVILDAVGRCDEALATYEAGLARCPDSAILRAGMAPLQRDHVRSTFKVIRGGLS